MNTSIVPGSLQAIATMQNVSIAESFVNAQMVVIVDVSGSMAANDSRDNQTRYDVACQELASLQAQVPGKVAVISFSEHAQFCPGGVPVFEGAGTALHKALSFSRIADVAGMRFIVISDGEPDDQDAALREAARYKNRIDVIYVGREGGPGLEFLRRLSHASGGTAITTTAAAMQIESKITGLLSAGI